MNALASKFLVILLIILGEAISIYAEMIAAKSNSLASQPFVSIFLKMFLVITVAGGFLVAGYALGINAFKNIWIVSVASITSILLIEPVLAYAVFQQLPTKGAIAGLIFGAMGFIAAIFY